MARKRQIYREVVESYLVYWQNELELNPLIERNQESYLVYWQDQLDAKNAKADTLTPRDTPNSNRKLSYILKGFIGCL